MQKNNYELELIDRYPKANKINKNITILAISDTHNHLDINELENINDDYEVCVLLGDISQNDLDLILKYIPREKIIGIHGNCDRNDFLDKNNINNIHGKVIDVNGIKFAGISGSYLSHNGFNHEESLTFLNNLPNADILISHDKAYTKKGIDKYHLGLKGITTYLYKERIAYHLHGHLHQNDIDTLLNGTISIGVYGIKIIKL